MQAQLEIHHPLARVSHHAGAAHEVISVNTETLACKNKGVEGSSWQRHPLPGKFTPLHPDHIHRQPPSKPPGGHAPQPMVQYQPGDASAHNQ